MAELMRMLMAEDDPRDVVILTSSREQRDLIEGYNLGVNAYVVNEPPPGSVSNHK
jgi:DNA-binding NarL/FixJ family response regulator